LFNKAL